MTSLQPNLSVSSNIFVLVSVFFLLIFFYSVPETYCWGHSTFSVLSTKYTGGNEERISNESRFFHTYYQWVPIVLFLQAICFYFPHFLWKNSDSCLISEYAKNIKGHLVPIEKIRYVSDHFLETLHQHPRLWLFYLLLEFANLGNLLFQFMFLSSFLDVDFLTLGYDMLKYYLGYSQHNPMVRIQVVIFFESLLIFFVLVSRNCSFHFSPSAALT